MVADGTIVYEPNMTNISTKLQYDEPIMREKHRLTIYPIVHNDIWELYLKQRKAFWVPEEVQLDKDRHDFMKLNKETQNFIKNILAFFATADGAVIMNISDNFINDIEVTEIQQCYNYQIMMEGIHADMYGLLINEIIQDLDEKHRMFNAVTYVPCIKEKNDWGLKWAYSGAPFVQRLVANAIVEGIFFSGSFCAIYWLKTKNIMEGLCQSNELISRDENMHCELAYTIYVNKIKHKMDDKLIKEMVNDAVNIEKKFINESLKCDLIGMNSKLMSQYIEYVADVLLKSLGHSSLYNSTNPFDFMNNDFNLQIKGNFFETKITSYQKAGQVVNMDTTEDF